MKKPGPSQPAPPPAGEADPKPRPAEATDPERRSTSSHGSDSGSLSRRGFVTHAAAAGAGGLLANVAVGRDRELAAAAPGNAERQPGAGSASIPKRPFGRTGSEISIVGFGAGSRFYGSTPDDETGAELIRAAIEGGVDFVETGANYGGEEGISERRIGLAMRTHRNRVFLETKVDERDYDGAMREMERSMDRMQTDHLDLVLHHLLRNEEEVAQVAGSGGAEGAIRKMMDEGVVRHRGLSAHTPEVARAGLEQLDPEAIQLPINAVRVPDFEAEIIPAAAEAGVAVIAMKTCGNGYFFPANATTPDRIERYGPPEGAWDRWDLPTWTDYIHYVLSLPIATATIGIDSYFTLEGVTAAASTFAPLAPERMASIHQRAQVFSTTGYWIPRRG